MSSRTHLHHKTHFKAATSIFMQNKEASLNLGDEGAREVVKEVFKAAGKELKESPMYMSNFSHEEHDSMDAPGGVVSGAQTLKNDSGAGTKAKLSRKISQEKLIEEKLETNKKLMNIMHKI